MTINQYHIFATQTWRGIRETVFQIWQPHGPHGPHASKTESFASCSGLLAICTLFPRVSWAHSSPVVRLSDCRVQLKWSRWYSETGYACSFWIRHLVSESDIQFLNPEFLNPVEFLNRTSFQVKSRAREREREKWHTQVLGILWMSRKIGYGTPKSHNVDICWSSSESSSIKMFFSLMTSIESHPRLQGRNWDIHGHSVSLQTCTILCPGSTVAETLGKLKNGFPTNIDQFWWILWAQAPPWINTPIGRQSAPNSPSQQLLRASCPLQSLEEHPPVAGQKTASFIFFLQIGPSFYHPMMELPSSTSSTSSSWWSTLSWCSSQAMT